jgi:hypothetical protein
MQKPPPLPIKISTGFMLVLLEAAYEQTFVHSFSEWS